MIYEFIDNYGTFTVRNPQNISYLYFPLTNARGTLLSCISPALSGDIKQDNEHFLTPPASIEDIKNNPLTRREFFLKLVSHKGKVIRTSEAQESFLEAGMLYHKIKYYYPEVILTIISFIPYDLDAEVTYVIVESLQPVEFIPTFFLPLYGRGENNLRDHRHVSSLLNRIKLEKYGIQLKPTMSFNERGHIVNNTTYFAYGYSEDGLPPIGQFPTLIDFCGEGGNLFFPEAVYKNKPFPEKKKNFDGKEACAALRFETKQLKKGRSAQYAFIAGISNDNDYPKDVFAKLNSITKINQYLERTKEYWKNLAGTSQGASGIRSAGDKNQSLVNEKKFDISSDNKNYNGWLKWVILQPTLRKLFGCSFLPHFDYGKGGRGWRDLWQDALSLLLIDSDGTKKLIINGFKGARIDGSNATIITGDGKFISDRNSISRVWSDHGFWPYFTLHEYIHKTGDINILLKETTYFRDHQLKRAREIDKAYTGDNILKAKDNKAYRGTILEHILIENLVQFFNVGKHNITRLENADWNDGLDMAYENGEGTAFCCMYADNLESISSILKKLSEKIKSVELLEEAVILLDTISAPIDYNHPDEKLKLLSRYFESTNKSVSGNKREVDISLIIKDLRTKSKWLKIFIRRKEWLKTGFFNGYYDNSGKRVEGRKGKTIRMMLTSQVFAIMSGVASTEQITSIWASIKKYLRDKRLKGFRLNTNFKELYTNLGRAFGFSYGDKENGAFFSHMAVMLAFSLYKRDFVNEGDEVFDSIYNMAISDKSKIYPMIPEYFNNEGRGLYFYLTGSASWYIYTLVHQILGIKYEFGGLIIEPKINKKKPLGNMSVNMTAGKRKFKINYFIKGLSGLSIAEASIDNQKIKLDKGKIIIPARQMSGLSKDKQHIINITLPQ